ncbi:MAG: hypothetical protein Q4C56_08985 [Peptococcaceae bacterium]|nr:hypothetical protein [Peptococcaceae bacterium]
MIKKIETIIAYRKQYPDETCGYLEPSDFVMINNGEITLLNPPEETDAIFLDRLERSKAAGRNLFYEEWTDEFVPIPGARY